MVCWWKVQYEVKDYVEMPGKIVFQLRGSSELMNEDRTYDNEYVWIFHLTDGPEPKIKHGKEFFDSLYAHQFFASISGAQEGWSHAKLCRCYITLRRVMVELLYVVEAAHIEWTNSYIPSILNPTMGSLNALT